MRFFARDFVRAFMPAAAMALCHGCGGNDEAPHQVPAGQESAPQTAANGAPVVTVAGDAYARAGEAYEYRPTASDPDGDALTFGAQNLPPWARIDPASGAISGTPAATDAGVYENVSITAADATRRTASSAFSITVLDAATGVATLRWEIPPSKVDGSPLDDLAGYRILYGRNADDLDQSVFIPDAATTSYDFAALDAGIWYFAVVAVNAGGLEGPPTTAAMKSI